MPSERGDAGRMGRRAVFVERDGTLNPDLKYLADASRLDLYKGVADGIRLLESHGYLVVCVTNQSGVERGLYTVSDVERIHERLNEILRTGGAHVDRFYYCPHAPESHCECRKPGTLLFERAREDLGVQFSASAIVGDRVLDIEAGHKLGLLTVLVASRGHAAEVREEMSSHRVVADIEAPSFLAAAVRILARG
ncbi:MAG TPA: HAD family hydrolase [Thermoplasmata archaeon]|nr:HAD family hydrolase [Thermoplasmata archaeon]